jgi:cell division protein ZapA (FtsZ GTPase activity inhibitor)
MHKKRIKIFGKEYTVASSEDEDYAIRIANYVDRKLKEISRISEEKSFYDIAILACLNITDELFEERNKNEILEDRLRSGLRRLDKEITE